MIDPKALEELDLASRAIERARALLARVDPKAMEASRRIMERAERIESNKRPTVAELEAILAQADSPPVHINSDGSIGAGENDALTVARALLAGEGNNATAAAVPFDPWQPISTAPKDGTTIFGCAWKLGQRGLISFNGREWEMVNGLTNFPMGIGFYPTHWMPEPAFPEVDFSGENAGLTQAARSDARPSSSPSPAVRDGQEKNNSSDAAASPFDHNK